MKEQKIKIYDVTHGGHGGSQTLTIISHDGFINAVTIELEYIGNSRVVCKSTVTLSPEKVDKLIEKLKIIREKQNRR